MKSNTKNINLLKLAIKTEFKWLQNSKKTIFFTILGSLISLMIFIPGAFSPKTNLEFATIYFLLLGIAASFGQYFLDSTYKDIQNKINIFYSNLNISIAFLFIAKIIFCIPLFLLFIFINLFLSIKVSILSTLIFITYTFNVIIYTYLIVTYFFKPNSVFLSLYIPLVFTASLAYFSAKIGINYMNLILQITCILLGVFSTKIIFKSKKITIIKL